MAFIIAGHVSAIASAKVQAADLGASSVQQLKVSGAFHTPLMLSAQEPFRRMLQAVQVSMPRCPVYSNVTGLPFQSVEEIRRRLVEQLVSPVLWSDIVADIFSQSSPSARFVHLGPGRSMTASLILNNRRITRQCKNVHPL